MREFRPITKAQIQEVADTHDIVINPKRMVNAPDVTTNLEPGTSLADRPIHGVSLDGESVERIADAVVRRLARMFE